jgi:hypothetical protein
MTYRGSGKVYKEQQFIGEVEYEVRQTRNFARGGTPTGLETSIRISPPEVVAAYFGADRLTLHMADGKKQNFIVQTSDGHCIATGGPY